MIQGRAVNRTQHKTAMTDELNETLKARAAAENAWLSSVSGLYLQAKEAALYNKAVFDLFGFNALQMGGLPRDLLKNSRIAHRFAAADTIDADCALYCDDEFLPFAAASLDLLLLPHRLEFSERPHQTLREAERVLMPEGHLIISGFNPISLWGVAFGFKTLWYQLWRKKTKLAESYPWRANLIRLGRLKDWLSLLGFEVMVVERVCHIPPFGSEKMHRHFAWMDRLCSIAWLRLFCRQLGGVYFVVARKRVPGVTPLKPKWKVFPIAESLIPRPSRTKVKEPRQSPQSTHSTIERKSK